MFSQNKEKDKLETMFSNNYFPIESVVCIYAPKSKESECKTKNKVAQGDHLLRTDSIKNVIVNHDITQEYYGLDNMGISGSSLS